MFTKSWLKSIRITTTCFEQLLNTIRPQWQINSYDVINGILPQDVTACDGYLITGSQYSTYDDLPWIPALEDFIRQCHQHQKKLLGVCFGHQLVAHVLGGQSGPCDRGWGLGIKSMPLKQVLPFVDAPQPESFRLIYSHQDQVSQLPAGAELLAGNAHCPLGMYRVGNHIWCCQGHPEFTPAYAEALYLSREELLGRETMVRAIDSLKGRYDRAIFALWMAQFFEAP